MSELLLLQKDGLKLTCQTVYSMSKNKEKEAEIKVEEIEKISETLEVEESKEESTETSKPAKSNKQEKNKEKVEVIQNGSFRFNKKFKS
jgi:hypothetical protein